MTCHRHPSQCCRHIILGCALLAAGPLAQCATLPTICAPQSLSGWQQLHSILCALGWPLGTAWACKARVGLSVLLGQEVAMCSSQRVPQRHTTRFAGCEPLLSLDLWHALQTVFAAGSFLGAAFMPACCTLSWVLVTEPAAGHALACVLLHRLTYTQKQGSLGVLFTGCRCCACAQLCVHCVHSLCPTGLASRGCVSGESALLDNAAGCMWFCLNRPAQ